MASPLLWMKLENRSPAVHRVQ